MKRLIKNVLSINNNNNKRKEETTSDNKETIFFSFRVEGAWVQFMSLQLEMAAFFKTVVPITVTLITFTLLQSPD